MDPRSHREVVAGLEPGGIRVEASDADARAGDGTRFVWFWTFWAWSRESWRAGALLRDPLGGIGGNWSAWYRHEACEESLRAIEVVARDESLQGQFAEWLFHRWACEVEPSGNRSVGRFVALQLSRAPPFHTWPVFDPYRGAYGAPGVFPIVLTQGSVGNAEDVRLLEALVLPDFSEGRKTRVTTEDFRADDADLDAARRAALGLFGARSKMSVFTAWLVGGRRFHGRAVKVVLIGGWVLLGGLILWLRYGPDPGAQLATLAACTAVLWCGLILTALATIGREAVCFAREAQQWRMRLEKGHLWLRMPGGLTVKGGSAGLAICLNALLAVYRAFTDVPQRSRIWKTIFEGLIARSGSCAATGVVTPGGKVESVVIEPKIRACLQNDEIRCVLTPRQRDARTATLGKVGAAIQREPLAVGTQAAAPLGYAAGYSALRLHSCSRVESALLAVSKFFCRQQLALTTFAFGASIVVLMAAQDLRGILAPPPAPIPVAGSFASPDILHFTLATSHASYFRAAFESDFWVNRQIVLTPAEDTPDLVRLQVSLVRTARRPSSSAADDGTIWIERRYKFLGREFQREEKVGRYSVSYLSHLSPR